jgi:hypothetical protein
MGIPVHLFLHEDYPFNVAYFFQCQQRWWRQLTMFIADRLSSPVIRRAKTRFSVSPGMQEEMARKGIQSELLYPSRGEDSPIPMVRVNGNPSGAPTVAHCGSLHLRGNGELLNDIAEIVGADGGTLDLYTNHTADYWKGRGLVSPFVRRIGFFPPTEMAERLASTAHCLVVTASFYPEDRYNETTLFPSKMADYTAVGLPIIVWGPPSSSIARWASAHPGACALITDRDPAFVRSAIMRFVRDPQYSASVSARGVEVGRALFDPGAARSQFYRAITQQYESRDRQLLQVRGSPRSIAALNDYRN